MVFEKYAQYYDLLYQDKDYRAESNYVISLIDKFHAKTKKEMYKAIDNAMEIIRKGKVPKFQIVNGMTGEMIGWPEKQEYHWQPRAITYAARELK